MCSIHSYRNLVVWQRSTELAVAIYQLTRKFPQQEQFGLISQMQRAAISIPSNIAEGRYRGTKKEFGRFLRIAYASGAELETQMYIAEKLEFLDPIYFKTASELLKETMKMLNKMTQAVSPIS